MDYSGKKKSSTVISCESCSRENYFEIESIDFDHVANEMILNYRARNESVIQIMLVDIMGREISNSNYTLSNNGTSIRVPIENLSRGTLTFVKILSKNNLINFKVSIVN